jgi:hypothetical protein
MISNLLKYHVKIGNAPWVIIYFFEAKNKQFRGFEIQWDGVLEAVVISWIVSHLPVNEESLVKFSDKIFDGKKAHIQYVPDQLSFDMFWKKYANTMGNKKRAQKIWDLLPQTEQLAAFAFIDQYNGYLRQNPNLSKAYPDTYLSQERWKN